MTSKEKYIIQKYRHELSDLEEFCLEKLYYSLNGILERTYINEDSLDMTLHGFQMALISIGYELVEK